MLLTNLMLSLQSRADAPSGAFVADLESGSRSERLSGTPREDLTHGARSLYAKLADGLVYVTALRYEVREDR